MNKISNRIVIYVKDVMNIISHHKRAACKLLNHIRKQCNKESGAFDSIYEFCHFTGLRPEHVLPFLV